MKRLTALYALQLGVAKILKVKGSVCSGLPVVICMQKPKESKYKCLVWFQVYDATKADDRCVLIYILKRIILHKLYKSNKIGINLITYKPWLRNEGEMQLAHAFRRTT